MKASEQKFLRLIREHRNTVYTVCYMFSKDEEEVRDLFQEVMANLWLGFGKFAGRSSEKSWVYRVALNTCISVNRKERRRPATLSLNTSFNLFEDGDEDTRQVDQLHSSITRLQPVDRALVLLWLEDLSYEEIGQIIGITAKNVSVRLHRIKEQLKQMNSHGKDNS